MTTTEKPATAKTTAKRKPTAKVAAKPSAEADAMHAEAMAAPLGEPLSPYAAGALASASPHVSVAILEPLGIVYDACRAVTEEDCEALLDEWHAAGRAATFGPLSDWYGALVPRPVPASPFWPPAPVACAFTADAEADEALAARFGKFEAAHDAEPGFADPVLAPDEDAPGERTSIIPVAESLTETFAAVTDEDGSA